jgi:isoleucyl-tRNA synthetase
MEPYEPKRIQEEISKFWIKNKIPDKIVKFNPKRKKFFLLDGPPYVNGVPHVGHIKTTTMKDIWSKFRTMQGFSSWWQPGFDCGGLPIENAVEKKLGIKSKKDIERKVGIDRFIQECKNLAEGNKQVWLETYRRLGAWRGWLEPYMTYKNYYLESGWWTVKRLYEKGMLVEGEKPLFWCPHCETTLAGYEVTDSYKDVTDYSIYVKYPVKGKKNEYILIWTTTPWTLPANVAIAVHPDETYVRVRMGGDVIIMAEKRLKDVAKESGIDDYKVLEKIKGKDLAGMKYEPALDIPLQRELKKNKNSHRVILSLPLWKKAVASKILSKKKISEEQTEVEDFVTMDTGSGCVHTAPGHGETDFRIGEHYKLPKVSPVDEEGLLTEETGEFAGMFVKDADPKIIDYLDDRNLLLWHGKIEHSYPLCWRCKTPLIYRLSKQWFFTIDPIKDLMINENKRIVWLPEFARERFHDWVSNATDWAISVQRYWGIPLPIWICKSCGAKEVIGSRKELAEKAIGKVDENIDMHKNTVDKIELKCPKCGKEMERTKDTMNVWFDSGISPWASLGYPFKNKKLFEKLWPMDLVCEGQDHIRGWFYSLMFMGTSTFGVSPFEAVAMTGWTLDEKGKKMSKSLGNVIYAEDALNQIESDLLRYYYCWSVAPWDTQHFSLRIAKELRRVLSVLWNTSEFTLSYSDKKFIGKKIPSKDLEIEDKWVISKINSLTAKVTKDLEEFNLHYVGRNLGDFILNDFSRWYIKIVRDRLSPWYSGKDKKSAQFTLLYVLELLVRMMAPITPFITEKIYQKLFARAGKPKSIHFSSWPKPDKTVINKKLEEEMEIVRGVVETVNSLRQERGIKLRWPVSKLYIKPKDGSVEEVIKKFSHIIRILGNVEEIVILGKIPQKQRKAFEHGEISLGEVLKEESLIRELIRNIQVLRKKEGLNVHESIELSLSSDKKTEEILSKHLENISKGVGAKKVRIGKPREVKGELKFESRKVKIDFKKMG